MLKQMILMEKLTMKMYVEKIIPLIKEFEKAVQDEAKLATNARFMYGLSAQLKRLLRQTQAQIEAEFLGIENQVNRFFSAKMASGLAKDFVNSVDITQKETLNSEISSVLGRQRMTKLKGLNLVEDAGLKPIIKDAISENVDLIQSIPNQYLGRVKTAVLDGLAGGKSTKTLGKEISDIGGVTRRRGQFIARDQLGSVYGKLSKKRNDNLGLKRFRWLTSHDSRVRDSHEKLDGHIYEWDKGAEGPEVEPEVWGLVPGEDFNCRCTTSVVEEDVFAMFDTFAD